LAGCYLFLEQVAIGPAELFNPAFKRPRLWLSASAGTRSAASLSCD
jgi:hypothetical protein